MEKLAKAAEISLRLPLADKQHVLMCNAIQHGASYVFLIGDYTETNTVTIKSYAPVAFVHIQWGAKKPTLVMT